MNAEQLLAQYEKVAEAPDAIERLRRFVLDLAVRGKLLEQKSTDEPATELLRQITSEKQRLVLSGELRKPRELGDDESVVVPFSIPSTWQWTRLDSIGAIVGGGTPSASDLENFTEPGHGVPWLTPADLGGHEELFISRGSRDLSEKGLRSSSATLMPAGSVLFTSRAPIGYVAIAANPISTNQGFKSIVPYVAGCSRFVALAMTAFAPEIDAKAPGTTFKEVSGKLVAAVPFPLPPLAEQHRIVAKVDELMALCDRLEAARVQREATRDRLTAATLARLNAHEPEESPADEAPNASSFQSDARFALDTLTSLTTRRDQITQLRRTILNLAVRGALTQREPDDISAKTLLQQIAAEAPSKLYAQSKLASDPPYAIPSNWQWAALGQLIVSGPQNGLSPKPTTRPDAPKAITLTATTSGEFNSAHYKHVDVALPSDSDLWLRDGDLLFQRGNTREYVGMAAIFTGPPSSYLYPDLMIRVRLSSRVDLRFIHLASIAPPARKYFSDNATGAQLTMPKINQTTLLALPVPLPPKLEQHRIVAKVDELMSLCDQLEASLGRGESTRSRLLDALLHEALQQSHDNVVDLDARRKQLLEMRQAIGCRIVERLSRTKGFGRTRAVKPFYWAEAHCGIALGGRWGRGNFGPYDQWIMSFESDAVSADWFSCIEHPTSDGGSWIEYRPGSQLTTKAKMAAQVLDKQAAEFERVLTLLAGLDTDKTEIVTTLFAAWNDLLIEGKPVSDSIVISEMREHWHPSKGRFTSAQLQPWLDWLRQNDLVPKGLGPGTRHQTELL